jgi:hypothetical protein
MATYIPQVQWRAADKDVIRALFRAVKKTKASDRIRLALFQAAVVETNVRNLKGGDRDSVGVLQQRAGWGTREQRMNPEVAAIAFIRDAQKRVVPAHPDYKAAKVAQAVQRSAYPTRYRLAYLSAQYMINRAIKEGLG